ncbi:MAG: hypothetical protein PHX21_05085 [bacterium]|nr:hypothetical protein [bacterium]
MYKNRLYIIILVIIMGCSKNSTFGPKEVKALNSPLKIILKETKHIGMDGYNYHIAISNSYAYLATGGVEIMDVSDPLNPYGVGHFYTTGFVYDIAILDSLAYITDDEYGIRILNVSNPANPQQIGKCDIASCFHDIAVSGSYAYVISDSGLYVIDVSNPATPCEVGRYSTGYDNWPYYSKIAVNNGYVYIVNSSTEVITFDASTPSSLKKINSCCVTSDACIRGITISSPYIYITGTYSAGEAGSVSGGLWIIDVSTPSAPKEIGFCKTGEYPNGIAVSGNYAYITDVYTFNIVDITNLSAPREIAVCKLPGFNEVTSVTTIGHYAYAILDCSDGFYIIDTDVKL